MNLDKDFFTQLKIERISNSFAKNFMERHHYTHTCPKCTIAYSISYKNELQCVVVYGQPSGKYLASSIWEGGNEKECLELLRLFSFDNCPKNIESFSISASIKRLKQDMPEIKVLVSYADGSAGHIGYIYQASSWDYIGIGSTERKIFIDGERQHRRTLYDRYGTSSIMELKNKLGDRLSVEGDRLPKYKYIKIIKDKNKIKRVLKCKVLPYPKGDIKRYSDTESVFDNRNGEIKKNKNIIENFTFEGQTNLFDLIPEK